MLDRPCALDLTHTDALQQMLTVLIETGDELYSEVKCVCVCAFHHTDG